MSINEEKLKSSMESIKEGLTEAGERLASVAQTIIEALDKMTPEQRMVIEFLAENPEVVEAFQELNQKLARQRAIEGATEETARPKEPKLNGEVREIVRHWAILHGYNWVRVGFAERATQTIFWVESPDTRKHIEFLGAYVADDFDAGVYSIDELCGAPEPLEPTFIDLDERIKEKEKK